MYFFMDPLMFFHESISISIIFLLYIITPNQKQSLVKNGIFFAPLKKIVVEPIGASIYLFGL